MCLVVNRLVVIAYVLLTMMVRLVVMTVFALITMHSVMTTVAVLVMLMAGYNSFIFMMNGTGLLPVFELDVGFLLMVLFVVRVLVVGYFMMNRVVVNDTGFVVVLSVMGGETLDIVVGVLIMVRLIGWSCVVMGAYIHMFITISAVLILSKSNCDYCAENK